MVRHALIHTRQPSGVVVLVIEDDAALAQMLLLCLHRIGVRCLLASTIQAAYVHLQGSIVNVVLCDLDLPDGSGLGLIRALLAKHPQLPVLAMTGLADHLFYAVAARQAGALATLSKPFSEQELAVVLKPWLAPLDPSSAP